MKEGHLFIEKKLKTIVDILMFYGSFNSDPGLCNGKMGIAIFLYKYARCCGNNLYSNYADKLLDQVLEDIGKTKPDSFENGMAGIGWGIEYLVQNNFVEADTDNVLEELDERIFNFKEENEQVPIEESSYFGLGIYFLERIKGHEKGNKNKIVQKNKEKLILCTNHCEEYLIIYNKRLKDTSYYNFKYLSGGEQQLASIAKALTQEPSLLLLDEPTSHLDISHQVQILNLIQQLSRNLELTVVMIIHDLNLASEYCDHLVLMKNGAVFQHGTPNDILNYKNIEEVYNTVVITQENPLSKKPSIFLVSNKILTNSKKLKL